MVIAMSSPRNGANDGRISEATIRRLANAKSFERGREYFDDGTVSNIVLRGDRLSADVEGSHFDPYQVSIRLNADGVTTAYCNCPYDGGGCCKHVVAVLLAFADERTTIIEQPPIAERLAALDRAQLIDLLEKRAASDAGLADWIEAELATETPPRSSPRSPQSNGEDASNSIDPEPIGRQATALLAARHRSRHYWDDNRSSGDIDELQRLAEKAVPFLEAGDGLNALRVLSAIGEAIVEELTEPAADSDEDLYELFADLSLRIAEAALTSELAEDERDAFIETLDDWQDRLHEFGLDTELDLAIGALQSGWDQPELVAVLAGKRKSWPPADADHWIEEGLTGVRLRVLEARGRTEDYLKLSRAARAHASHASMLVKLGQLPEAAKYALKSFTRPNEALIFAMELRERAAHDEALSIAEAGLGLAGHTSDLTYTVDDIDEISDRGSFALARWLRDYAGQLGKRETALKAAIAAFRQSLSLEDFSAVRTWAGADWEAIRGDLLQLLASAVRPGDRLHIYLAEGLIDAAVRAIGDEPLRAAHDESLMQLAGKAHASHPEWTIRVAMYQASSIMDANQTGFYELAAQWLEKAALAHETLGREDEWQACLDDLIARHRRKYKLLPLLKGLRGR